MSNRVNVIAVVFRAVRWLHGTAAARCLLAVGSVFLAVEGTWSVPVHTSIAFGTYVILLLTALGLRLFRFRFGVGWLAHAGMWLIIAGSFFGMPDRVSCRMYLYEGEACNMAYMENGMVVVLPFTVALDRFETEYYDAGRVVPRQFRSHLYVDGRKTITEVNAPATCMGYTIYQDGYDVANGRYTVLLLVRDPWLPVVYAGMALLAVAAILLVYGGWRLKVMLPITVLLAVVFTVLTVAKINFQTLVPALRSCWFVPHIALYMIAYALVAIAAVIGIREHVKGKCSDVVVDDSSRVMQLMRSASGLIILGMLMGSVWAKQAWGDYWGWDPKENWAAVTLLLTLMCVHLRSARRWKYIVYVLLAFVALQITWYGVNFLPSAADSLHTYN